MSIALFSERNIKTENINNLEIADHEAKRKIIENWQKGIISGKILSQNEKKLQSEFLNKIFGDVLGYSYEKHLDTWQLENELKVNLDGRTPDGALGYFNFENGKINHQVFAVIELKGPLSNLDKKQNRSDFKGTPVEQAFSYVPKLDKPCPWVIVSNCQEIRLYRYALGMAQYESFNILELLQNGNFKRFCYLLQQGQLFLNVTDSPVERLFLEREKELKNITNEFYERYKDLREKLFDQVRKNNPEIPAVDLLRCTQKLIDRLLFMCFVRDLDIVKNMINAVNKAVEESFDQEEDALWKQLKYAFVSLDKGYRRKNIPPFNGGLFRKDELLENLVVKDFRLGEFMDFLNQYDYQNQLNINVLGHIFEQSISDIEGIKSRLQDEEPVFEGINENTAKAVNTKRKADGVFYTPEYITRYMVEQALGAYLDEAEDQILATMNITELPALTVDDYKTVGFDNTMKSTNNDNINLHLNYWERYDDILRKIKVIDPACGSGAFLTQVFDYLYERWKVLKTEVNRLTTPYEKALKELEALQKMGNNGFAETPFDEWIIKKNIIQNNLFGVDLNPESVEITKLSLWMKTANKKEKLADMDGNIKQGNSLIDDPEFSDSAFDWQSNFSDVFEDGGFDIVVGNPPYVRQELLGKINKEFYGKRFSKVGNGTADLYVYFYELGLSILKPAGYLSYITPNKWFKTKYGKELRHFIHPFDIQQIIDFFELKIFEDAATEPQIILVRNQEKTNDFEYLPVKLTQDFVERKLNPILIHKQNLQDSEWVFADDAVNNLLEKLQKNSISLDEYTNGGILYGIKTGLNRAFVIDKSTKESIIKKDPKSAELIKPYIQATDIKAWHLENKDTSFLIFTRRGTDIEKYVGVKNHLMQFFDDLKPKTSENDVKGRKPGTYKWFELQDSVDYFEDFDKPKIMYIRTAVKHYFYLDSEKYRINDSCYIISNADLFVAIWLNSAVFEFYKKLKFVAFGNADDGGRCKLDYNKMVNVPIPILTEEQKAPFIEKAELMLQLNKELYEKSQGFLSVVRSELKVEKINEKLENWFSMTYEGFVSEVKKQRGGFKDLAQQMEWQGFFKENQLKAVALKEQIDKTNAEIDEMVFRLYGLSAEEIGIVRG
jgi:Eco57I restriction-modification methylase